MSNTSRNVLLVVAAFVVGWLLYSVCHPAVRLPHWAPPRLHHYPYRTLIKQVEPAGKIVTGGPVAPDGKTEVVCDLPVDQRKKNVGGRDGAGLCVFTSIMHAARWQNETRLANFQDQMRNEPGGGYPEKVDAMVKKYGPGTQYIQYEGKDPSVLEAALKTGRMVCVTYNGHDGVHYGGSIAHMVNLVYLDNQFACVLDNNFIGANDLVWMNRQDFLSRWTGGRDGWAVVLLNPPPPPPPHN